jgi:hypothetical protein
VQNLFLLHLSERRSSAYRLRALTAVARPNQRRGRRFFHLDKAKYQAVSQVQEQYWEKLRLYAHDLRKVPLRILLALSRRLQEPSKRNGFLFVQLVGRRKENRACQRRRRFVQARAGAQASGVLQHALYWALKVHKVCGEESCGNKKTNREVLRCIATFCSERLRLLGGNGLLSSCGAQNAKLHLRDSLLFEGESEVGIFRLFGQRPGADLGDAYQVFGVGLDKRAWAWLERLVACRHKIRRLQDKSQQCAQGTREILQLDDDKHQCWFARSSSERNNWRHRLQLPVEFKLTVDMQELQSH